MNKKLKDKLLNLKEGSAFILPTDTVYGLTIKISNINDFDKYINKIYDIKKRDKNKKIILLIDNIDRIYSVCDKNNIDERLLNILKKYWPGNLSVILKTNDKIKEITNYDTIGIRIPNNKLAIETISLLGGYLFVTSANISGMKSPISILDIDNNILKKCDLVIEDENNSGIPSTILNYTNKDIDIVRMGSITKEMLEDI